MDKASPAGRPDRGYLVTWLAGYFSNLGRLRCYGSWVIYFCLW